MHHAPTHFLKLSFIPSHILQNQLPTPYTGASTSSATRPGAVRSDGQSNSMRFPAAVKGLMYDGSSKLDCASSASSGLQMNKSSTPIKDLEYGCITMANARPEGGMGLSMAVAVTEEEDPHIVPAVEFDPDAKPPVHSNNMQRFYLYALLMISVVVLTVVVAVVFLWIGQQQEIPQIPIRETIGIRETLEPFVGSDVFDDKNSPYQKALDWIMHEDPLQLMPSDPSFVQRYYMAYFYFATSVRGPWNGNCAPLREGVGEHARCDGPSDGGTIPSMRWLSNTTECLWGGLSCDRVGQIKGIEFDRFQDFDLGLPDTNYQCGK